MKNLKIKELSTNELMIINGGASWGYRFGQLIRLSFMSQGGPGNLAGAVLEFARNEALSE